MRENLPNKTYMYTALVCQETDKADPLKLDSLNGSRHNDNDNNDKKCI